MTKVLVIGGYGGFGGRLSRRLADRGADVVVAGRSLAKAEAFCRSNPSCRPARADRNEGVSGLIESERPNVVIDASGPFQSSDYRLVAECIAAGVSYLDLADSRAFVAGVSRFDSAAQMAGVLVITGASSVPALSGAVARKLADGLDRVTSVEIAISASSRASAGASVATAILDGVGQKIPLWRGARRIIRFGWQELRREPFGHLGSRLVALADVPDVALLPGRLPGSPAVTFRAGTESMLANCSLWLASWPVRWGWIQSLRPLSRLLLAAHRLTAVWGGDRSGMVVRLFGIRGAQRIERRWTLTAEDGDGPHIPTLAAAILTDRIAKGELRSGARDAGEELALADFEPMFATLAVRHSVEEIEQPPPLYRRLMGDGFDRLAPALQAMHGVLRDSGAHGRGKVERGTHPLARLVAKAMRFPRTGDHPLHVHFAEDRGVERWTRDFGGQCFASSSSRAGDQVVERHGPLRFHFDLQVADGALEMVMRHWSVLGLPLPLALAPRSPAREREEDGRFHFDVPIDLPLIGRVIHYRGWVNASGHAGPAANQKGTSSSRSVSNAAG
ncbi:MAG: precorrin-6A/cobalt-precorrin-6A reductase [Sphingomicrobium sp.]